MELTEKEIKILEKIPISVFVTDPRNNIIWLNRRCLNLLKWDLNDVIGTKFETFLPNKHIKLFKEGQERIFKTGQPDRGLILEFNIGNAKKWFQIDRVPLKDNSDIIEKILIFISDYTTQYKEIQDRVDSEFKYRNLFETSPEAILIVNKNGRIFDCNDKACELAELEQEEILGKHFNDVVEFKPDKYDRNLHMFEKILIGKKIPPCEHEIFVNKDKNNIKFIEIHVSPMFRNNRVDSVQIMVRDLTKRKMAENALILNERRTLKERMKSEKLESIGLLAGGIAHDFNNILTAIMGNISLLEITLEDNEESSSPLEDTKIALTQAKKLTQQLLTFSKGGAPIKKSLNISKLLVDSSKFILRGSNCHCSCDIEPNLWSVYADEGQISQVINNIIINAKESMLSGGKISISAKNETIDSKIDSHFHEGNYVSLKISDQGVGIADENLSKIFDPYFTTKEKGMGLGLATTYSIVKKHDGYIKVDSIIGKGSSFTVLLPAIPGVKIHPKKKKKVQLLGNGRILIMDDELMIRKVASKMLNKVGFDVVCAKDGYEALDFYKQGIHENNKFDVVIMDLTIPGGKGGKETISELIKLDPDVKAIVSSGYSTDPIMANYEKYGFKGAVAKPYKIEDISAAVNRII